MKGILTFRGGIRESTMFDLTGKVAVVTGGYRGIGYGIAEGFAEGGADIVICARHLERCQEACSKIEKLGVKALPVRCDVSDTSEVDNLISATVREFGKIDILVNNASTAGSAKSVVEMSDEEWDETIAIDLKGAFLCSRAAAREMIKQNRGKIINVASVYYMVPLVQTGDYSASKGGLVTLTKVMALELIRHNINVNVICPGYVDTEFSPTLLAKIQADARRRIPIGRLAKVDELKGIAVYLASPASDYMVGSVIMIDGGVSCR
jgi:gluconate 5-dehydrogenase